MSKETRLGILKNLTTAIIVAVIVMAVLFIPMIPVKEDYNQTEEYEREAMYEVVSVTLEEQNETVVVVKNIDAYGGTYIVTHYLYDGNELHETKFTGEYLAAGQNKTFRAEFDTKGLQDVRSGYSVSAPTVIDRRVIIRWRIIHRSIIELLIYR